VSLKDRIAKVKNTLSLYYEKSKALIPNKFKIGISILFYIVMIGYLIGSVFFVAKDNSVGFFILDFPTNCNNFTEESGRSFCSMVYFNNCESYKSNIVNGTNHWNQTQEDEQDVGYDDLPLQSFYSFFKGLNASQFFNTPYDQLE